MKILHLYKDYFPVEGGIENHIKLLAETQASQGHDVTVMVTSRDRQTHVERINGVRVVFAGRLATISSAPISLSLIKLLGAERPDIAHLQFPYPWGEVVDLVAGHARKTVMTYQSDIVRQRYLKIVYAPVMNQVLKRMDAILATSPNYIQSSPVLARYRERCIAVPMGINTAPFLNAPAQAAAELRARLLAGAPAGTVLLLTVGVLRYYKGLNFLLEALPHIDNVRLAIVGRGPMEQEWKALAQKLGITSKVTFVGEVANPDLPPYYAASDIFALPSSERSEAFGLVQLEAMASAKPIVATELGTGTSFVTQDGINGIVVLPRSPAGLAQAIMRLVNDKELRAVMGAAGRKRALAEFTVDKMLARILDVYQNVLAR